MASSHYEERIKSKFYASAGNARAAVSRAGLSKNETQRLHTLVETVYAREDKAKALLAPPPVEAPPVEEDSLHKIALRVTLYALDNGKTINSVMEKIHSIIRNS